VIATGAPRLQGLRRSRRGFRSNRGGGQEGGDPRARLEGRGRRTIGVVALEAEVGGEPVAGKLEEAEVLLLRSAPGRALQDLELYGHLPELRPLGREHDAPRVDLGPPYDRAHALSQVLRDLEHRPAGHLRALEGDVHPAVAYDLQLNALLGGPQLVGLLQGLKAPNASERVFDITLLLAPASTIALTLTLLPSNLNSTSAMASSSFTSPASSCRFLLLLSFAPEYSAGSRKARRAECAARQF